MTSTVSIPSFRLATWEKAPESLINRYCAEAIRLWEERAFTSGLGGLRERLYFDADGKNKYLVEFWNPCVNPGQAKEVPAEVGWYQQGDYESSGGEIQAKVGVLGTALALADQDPRLALVVTFRHALEVKVPDQASAREVCGA